MILFESPFHVVWEVNDYDNHVESDDPFPYSHGDCEISLVTKVNGCTFSVDLLKGSESFSF
jgi:hypothetical protein